MPLPAPGGNHGLNGTSVLRSAHRPLQTQYDLAMMHFETRCQTPIPRYSPEFLLSDERKIDRNTEGSGIQGELSLGGPGGCEITEPQSPPESDDHEFIDDVSTSTIRPEKLCHEVDVGLSILSPQRQLREIQIGLQGLTQRYKSIADVYMPFIRAYTPTHGSNGHGYSYLRSAEPVEHLDVRTCWKSPSIRDARIMLRLDALFPQILRDLVDSQLQALRYDAQLSGPKTHVLPFSFDELTGSLLRALQEDPSWIAYPLQLHIEHFLTTQDHLADHKPHTLSALQVRVREKWDGAFHADVEWKPDRLSFEQLSPVVHEDQTFKITPRYTRCALTTDEDKDALITYEIESKPTWLIWDSGSCCFCGMVPRFSEMEADLHGLHNISYIGSEIYPHVYMLRLVIKGKVTKGSFPCLRSERAVRARLNIRVIPWNAHPSSRISQEDLSNVFFDLDFILPNGDAKVDKILELRSIWDGPKQRRRSSCAAVEDSVEISKRPSSVQAQNNSLSEHTTSNDNEPEIDGTGDPTKRQIGLSDVTNEDDPFWGFRGFSRGSTCLPDSTSTGNDSLLGDFERSSSTGPRHGRRACMENWTRGEKHHSFDLSALGEKEMLDFSVDAIYPPELPQDVTAIIKHYCDPLEKTHTIPKYDLDGCSSSKGQGHFNNSRVGSQRLSSAKLIEILSEIFASDPYLPVEKRIALYEEKKKRTLAAEETKKEDEIKRIDEALGDFHIEIDSNANDDSEADASEIDVLSSGEEGDSLQFVVADDTNNENLKHQAVLWHGLATDQNSEDGNRGGPSWDLPLRIKKGRAHVGFSSSSEPGRFVGAIGCRSGQGSTKSDECI